MYRLYGYGGLRDVELCGLLRQRVLLHQQRHHIAYKQYYQIIKIYSDSTFDIQIIVLRYEGLILYFE